MRDLSQSIYDASLLQIRHHASWCEYNAETRTSRQYFAIGHCVWLIARWSPEPTDNPLLYAATFQSGALAGTQLVLENVAAAMARAVTGIHLQARKGKETPSPETH